MMNPRKLPPQIDTQGLVLHYKLHGPTNGIAGTAAYDYSGQGNAGVLNGTSLLYKYPGLQLAGNNEYIDTGSPHQSTFRGSCSIAMWVKPDDGQPVAGEYFYGTQVGGFANQVRLLRQTDGKIACRYRSDGDNADAISNSAVFANGAASWTHIVCVMDSTVAGVGGVVIYVNGTVVALDAGNNGDTTAVTFADYTSTVNLFFGALNNNGVKTSQMAGAIDDLMIFNEAKSAADAKSLYSTTRWRYQK